LGRQSLLRILEDILNYILKELVNANIEDLMKVIRFFPRLNGDLVVEIIKELKTMLNSLKKEKSPGLDG